MFLDGFPGRTVNSQLQKLCRMGSKSALAEAAPPKDTARLDLSIKALARLLCPNTRQALAAPGGQQAGAKVKRALKLLANQANCTATNDKKEVPPAVRRASEPGKLQRARSARPRSTSLRCRSSKCGKQVKPWLSFLLLLGYLLIAARAAPLWLEQPLVRVQPIWLHEGLIALEPEVDLDAAEGRVAWPAQAAGQAAIEAEHGEPAGKLAEQESLWIQRRRLNRDRALEPAPWMREQPMRRGFNPTGALLDADQSAGEISEPSVGQQSSALGGGRKSRQLTERAYEDLIRYLIEEMLDNRELLSRLYDELSERIRAPQLGSGADPSNSEPDQLGELQPAGLAATADSTGNQEASLVLASDEVAAGDGAGATVDAAPYAKLELASEPLVAGSAAALVDQGPSSAAALDSMAAASFPEEPFHVLEDIDRADASPQEASVALPELDELGRPRASESLLEQQRELLMKRAGAARWSPAGELVTRTLGWPAWRPASADVGNLSARLMARQAGRYRDLPDAEWPLEGALAAKGSQPSMELLVALLREAQSLGIDLAPLVRPSAIRHTQVDGPDDRIEFVVDNNARPIRDLILAGSEPSLAGASGWQVRAQPGPGRLAARLGAASSSPLMAYLSALKPNNRFIEPLLRLQVPLSLGLDGETKDENTSQPAAATESPSSWLSSSIVPNQLGLIHLIALIGAFVCALVAVKLLLRAGPKPTAIKLDGPEKRNPRARLDTNSFRSFWSSAASQSGDSSSTAAAVLGSASKPANLGAAPPTSGMANRPKQVELLMSKMMSMMSRRPAPDSDESPLVAENMEEGRLAAKQGSPVEPLTCEGAEPRAEPRAELSSTASFRSSRSYIKSLMDVLAKARSQINPADLLASNTSTAIGDEPDLIARRVELLASARPANMDDDEDELSCGVVMSQMDISAAHLILDYMEKHLEDKERLRREWNELNASSDRRTGAATKLNQALLNRLAKSALSEPNRAKNSSLEVVPFDWNRVKLGSPARGCSALAQSAASGSAGPAGSGNAAGSRLQARQLKSLEGTSDYINASFIYDDDPRKPTHIIAQGPNQQTVGQFWQMIWEQGVSIIVMLTRLNENSRRMCHCYWPASESACKSSDDPATDLVNQEQNPMTGLDTNGSPSGIGPTQVGSAALSGNGRRGSVTSVFNKHSSRHNSSGHPIIANGDLNNNLLVFELPRSPSSSSASTSESMTNSSRQNNNKLELHLVSEHVSSDDFLVRNMYLVNQATGETRTITQFHYLAWPENGVPENAKSLLQFRRKVHKSYRNLDAPILVHCSDGAGRSGTYTLIDIILDRIKNGAKEIDPRATLEHLRDQRVGLCASQSQFEFVLVALAEEIQIILNALPQ